MYKEDVDPQETYRRLNADPSAVLVDVRTQPEWAFVGLPAFERLIRLSWQDFPEMQVNDSFVNQIEQAGVPKDTHIFCILPLGRSISFCRLSVDGGGI